MPFMLFFSLECCSLCIYTLILIPFTFLPSFRLPQVEGSEGGREGGGGKVGRCGACHRGNSDSIPGLGNSIRCIPPSLPFFHLWHMEFPRPGIESELRCEIRPSCSNDRSFNLLYLSSNPSCATGGTPTNKCLFYFLYFLAVPKAWGSSQARVRILHTAGP